MRTTQKERVEKFLAENYTGQFIISDAPNADSKLEVSSRSTVKLIKNIEHLTTDDFIFTKVPSFDCRNIKTLKSLKGAPQKVEEFYCNNCTSLQSLEGAPQKVEEFYCNNCSSLQSLEGAPQEVAVFSCPCCTSLQSLEGAPKEVEYFICSYCDNLKSLDEIPVCNTLVCDKRFKNSIPIKNKKEVILR